MGGLGPMLGQLGFFAVRSKEKVPAAIERLSPPRADRLLRVMDRRLGEAPYLAGDEYTIADIACYAWTLGATTMMKEPLAATHARRDAASVRRCSRPSARDRPSSAA